MCRTFRFADEPFANTSQGAAGNDDRGRSHNVQSTPVDETKEGPVSGALSSFLIGDPAQPQPVLVPQSRHV